MSIRSRPGHLALLLLPLLLPIGLVGVGGCDAGRDEPPRAPSRATAPPADGMDLHTTEAEIYAILLEPDVLTRTAALATTLPQLGLESVDQVLAAYDRVFMDLGEVDLVLLAEWWGTLDGPSAVAWTRTDWRAQNLTVPYAVYRAWGRVDPQAALEGAVTARTPRQRREFLDAVVSGWEESEHPGLVEYVMGLAENEDRQYLQYVIARRKVLRDGAEATFRWAEAFPDDDASFKRNLYRRVASSAAEVEPEAAAAWVEQQLGGRYASNLVQRVSTRWVKHDGPAAMAWLSTLPAGEERDEGVREGFRNWGRQDFAAADAWMRAQPVLEPWLEPAAGVWALQHVVATPDEALARANQIVANQALRRQTLIVVTREWLVRDEPAARAWIESADLDEQTREKIEIIPKAVRGRAERAAAKARAEAEERAEE